MEHILYVDIDSVSLGNLAPNLLARGDAPSRARRRVQVGDTIISMVRPNLRHYAFIASDDERLVASTGFALVRPKASIVPRFLYYALTTPITTEYLTRVTVGAAYPAFQPRDLARMEIPLPETWEQRRIATLLGSMDDRIGLNRRMRATLEDLARTLFASSVGNLAPDRAPEGWTVESLGDHVDVMRGLSYSGAGLADDGIPLHNLDSIYEGGGYKYEGIKHYRGEYKDRHIVRGGDLLLANTEQGFEYLLIGFPALVPQRFDRLSLFSHHLYRVRPKSGSWLTGRFLYLALMSPRLRQAIVGYSNGTTVNMLPVDALQRPRLAVPPAELVHRFDERVQPLFAKQEQLQIENETLARLRDLLLPKLMSGEIRLKDAEKAVAEAG